MVKSDCTDMNTDGNALKHPHTSSDSADNRTVKTIEHDEPEHKVHDGLDHKINGMDYSKPLVPQIYNFTPKQYCEVLHEPFLSNATVSLFPWWLEPTSRTKWFIIPILYLPIVAFLLFYSLTTKQYMPSSTMALFFGGILAWTFAEYMLHRFVFHFPESLLPDIGFARICHFLAHGVHHLLPMDPLRLVMPPAVFCILSSPFWMVWREPASWAGILLGYVAYDLIHYGSHYFPYNMPGLKFQKAYHMKHHYKHPDLAFGVSSPLWDIVFGTFIPS